MKVFGLRIFPKPTELMISVLTDLLLIVDDRIGEVIRTNETHENKMSFVDVIMFPGSCVLSLSCTTQAVIYS